MTKKVLSPERLDAFFKTALELAESGIQGQKILDAAKGGKVVTEAYHREIAPGFDGHIRELAKEVVFAVWSEFKRAATLAEIYNGIGSQKIPGVVQKIHEEMSTGEWPTLWSFPSKRTCDRRVNELASDDRTMWGDLPFQPVICLTAGHYRINPRFLDDDTREGILRAAGEIP